MPCAVATSPIFSSSVFYKSCPSPTIQSPSATSYEGVLDGNNGALLKRKRPGRISIPVGGVSGFGLNTPMVCEVDKYEAEEYGYSVLCKRGKRGPLEDRYSAFVHSNQAFFGVYDGHGGGKAAEYAAKNLKKNVLAELCGRCEEGVEGAIRNGYLSTDAEFIKEGGGGGACCVTAFIHQGNLAVSNAGDCRAVLSRGGVAHPLTSDHQPSRLDEKHRIEALGGYVDCCRGVWRVQGSLAVTRAIGDMDLKKWVIAEPETTVLPIEPDCEFLILASDGLWDKVTNQEAVDVVHPLCIGIDKPESFSACKKLIDLASRRGSIDDISVMIIQLDRFTS